MPRGWFVVGLSAGSMTLVPGKHVSPTVTIAMDAADYVRVVNGELDGARAFTTGGGTVRGKIRVAMKIRTIFPQASGEADSAPAAPDLGAYDRNTDHPNDPAARARIDNASPTTDDVPVQHRGGLLGVCVVVTGCFNPLDDRRRLHRRADDDERGRSHGGRPHGRSG